MLEFPKGGFNNEVPRGSSKTPVSFVIDTSGSLYDYKDVLASGFQKLIAALRSNPATAATVEANVITFDDAARIVQPYTELRSLEVPEFSPAGTTHIYEALDLAYSESRVRQEQYVVAGTCSNAPLHVILTDGKPVGDSDTTGIVPKIRERHAAKKLVPYPFAIGDDADIDLLKGLRADGRVFRVDMENLEDIFELLNVTLSSLAVGLPGIEVKDVPDTISFF